MFCLHLTRAECASLQAGRRKNSHPRVKQKLTCACTDTLNNGRSTPALCPAAIRLEGSPANELPAPPSAPSVRPRFLAPSSSSGWLQRAAVGPEVAAWLLQKMQAAGAGADGTTGWAAGGADDTGGKRKILCGNNARRQTQDSTCGVPRAVTKPRVSHSRGAPDE